MLAEGTSILSKNQRAAKSKVRTGCITCKSRHVKCDEGKPACNRCTRMGRICQGYQATRILPKLAPRSLAPTAIVSSPIEQHALEVFFICTAPQLAGYFEHSFFQGSVLQLSLAEPAIRQAIAALGILHEQAAADQHRYLPRETLLPELPIKLYNRAIRSIMEKVAADPNDNDFAAVAVINVLFICFEYFQGNLETAASHLKGGVSILNDWRSRNRQKQSSGRKYTSSETDFMETEIAPLLCTLEINAAHWGVGVRPSVVLDQITDSRGTVIPDRFESLRTARASLLSLVTFATRQLEPFNTEPTRSDFPVICETIIIELDRWKATFEDLVQRQWDRWNDQMRRAADAISVMRCNAQFGIYSYQAQSDCDWGRYRAQYQETAELLNKLITDSRHFPDQMSKVFSLDLRMVFPLRPVAWMCRWPHLHRTGLDLRDRLPLLDKLPAANQYHSISSRIREIEEAYLTLHETKELVGDMASPESLIIEDYSVVLSPGEEGQDPSFDVTFWAKPDGVDGPWYCFTENMRLGMDGSLESPIDGH